MDLDPGTLLDAYAHGAFPMADEDGQIRWFTAIPRGILPLDAFHVPKSLAQTVRQRRFEIRVNFEFEATMRACMLARPQRTWISEELIAAYVRLHRVGHAHSIEAWRGGKLAGGLYGVTLGGAFFGESMFHRERDASKVALVALVDRLRDRGYELLDTQMVTAHMGRFGCIEIAEADYLERLGRAIERDRTFVAPEDGSR
jgi:leucyl/phenylalanyl-tRNA--protein transferase